MKLTELNPNWVAAGGAGITNSLTGEPVPRRDGIGVNLNCPCGCKDTLFVPFKNPMCGGEGIYRNGEHDTWQRTGDTFETLTLTPSIQRTLGCKWHGYITNGEIVNC